VVTKFVFGFHTSMDLDRLIYGGLICTIDLAIKFDMLDNKM
jgi:hypothetical protein